MREPGYYRVKYRGEWQVALWDREVFWLINNSYEWDESDFEIDETRITFQDINLEQEVWCPVTDHFDGLGEIRPLCVIIWELPNEDNTQNYQVMTNSNLGHQWFIYCKREAFYLTKEECQKAIDNGVEPWSDKAFEENPR